LGEYFSTNLVAEFDDIERASHHWVQNGGDGSGGTVYLEVEYFGIQLSLQEKLGPNNPYQYDLVKSFFRLSPGLRSQVIRDLGFEPTILDQIISEYKDSFPVLPDFKNTGIITGSESGSILDRVLQSTIKTNAGLFYRPLVPIPDFQGYALPVFQDQDVIVRFHGEHDATQPTEQLQNLTQIEWLELVEKGEIDLFLRGSDGLFKLDPSSVLLQSPGDTRGPVN